MIFHPLILSILCMDSLSLLLLCGAALTRIRVLLGWEPGSAEHSQIVLERMAERADAIQPTALMIYAAASVTWIVGVANVLSSLLPGAMCGTGVIQAAGEAGGRAVLFRFLGLMVLYWAETVRRQDRHDPEGALVIFFSRISLVGIPLVFLGSLYTARAVLGMDMLTPVDCCAVVYDAARGVVTAGVAPFSTGTACVWGMILSWLFLPVLGKWILKFGLRGPLIPATFFFITTLLFFFFGAVSLINIFSSYFYQVLHHRCPWCFFLPEHGFAGFFLYAALIVVLAEGAVPLVVTGLYKKAGGIGTVLLGRVRRAVFSTFLGASCFVVLTTLPAILWRFRYGVWIGG